MIEHRRGKNDERPQRFALDSCIRSRTIFAQILKIDYKMGYMSNEVTFTIKSVELAPSSISVFFYRFIKHWVGTESKFTETQP